MKRSVLMIPVLVFVCCSVSFAITPVVPQKGVIQQQPKSVTTQPQAGDAQILPPKTVITQPQSGGAQAQQPKITGISPAQPEVVSKPDGTATVDVIVSGTGVITHECSIMVSAGDGSSVMVPLTQQSGFPKTVPFTFKKPSKYSLSANFISGAGCTGNAKSWVTVNPHQDYPCSKYPGYKKEAFGLMSMCRPEAPPANPQQSDFVCPEGTKFQSIAGYIFGCIAPGFFNQ